MSLAQPGLTDDHLAISLINIPEKALVLFEDIDCLFSDRNADNDEFDNSKNNNNVSNTNIVNNSNEGVSQHYSRLSTNNSNNIDNNINFQLTKI